MQTIGVLICSYRRPDSLLRGLASLAAQDRRPDDVLIVVRADDVATLQAVASSPTAGSLPLRVLTVTRAGTVHALNTGLAAGRTDVVAITDDDTVPAADWLARILAHFRADPALGGLGGRDRCHDGERFDDRARRVVGHLQWFGRTIGNHHLGVGAPQQVDFLKGANMSYRAEAIADRHFDTRLRGVGAQPYEDIAFSLGLRLSGWKLLYDPLVAVEHYPAPRQEPRHYAAIACSRDKGGLFDLAYNEVIALWDGFGPVGRLVYMTWSVLIGTGGSPGIVQAIRYTPRLGAGSWRRLWTVHCAKVAAYRELWPRRSGLGPVPRGCEEVTCDTGVS